jgi:hypothetical protein
MASDAGNAGTGRGGQGNSRAARPCSTGPGPDGWLPRRARLRRRVTKPTITAHAPPGPRGNRGDRRGQYLQVIGDGARSGAAGAEHPGQRLSGVIAVSQQWMMAVTFVIRLRAGLPGVRRDDGRIQPDARHPVQDLVRDPHARDLAVPGRDPRPCPPLGGVHRGSNPRPGPRPAGGDLAQRPPRRRHRRNRAGYRTTKCVEDSNDSSANDTKIVIGDCNGRAGQRGPDVMGAWAEARMSECPMSSNFR